PARRRLRPSRNRSPVEASPRVPATLSNVAVLMTEPAGVVTLMGPLMAAAGTVAVMRTAETTVKGIDTLPMRTAVAPLNPAPLTVTTVPALPLFGVNEMIFGSTLNAALLVTVPAETATLMGPLTALVGTTAVISLGDTTV